MVSVTPQIDFDQVFMSVFARVDINTPRSTSLAVTQFLDAIQSEQYAKVIGMVRVQREKYKAGGAKPIYQQFKTDHLEAVTPSGVFHPIRVGKDLQKHTGIIIADVDDLDDPETAKEQLKSDPYVAYAFISPGNDGLKVGVRVVPCADGKTHTQAWLAVRDRLGAGYGLTLDPSGKDVNRQCYVSYDPLVYRNPDAVPLPIPDTETRPKKQRSVSGLPGDALNAEATFEWWRELLEGHDWSYWKQDENNSSIAVYTRPGYESVRSATVGFQPPDNDSGQNWLYVFSGSDECKPLNVGWCSPFVAYTLLEHDGDYKASAKALREQGYGAKAESSVGTGGSETIEWDLPIEFEQSDTRAFPNHALPTVLREYAEEVACATQTPVDMPAMLCLPVVGAALAKVIEIELKPKFTEQTNLYVAISMPPGSRKSSVFDFICEPFQAYEEKETERLGPEIARYMAQRRIKEKELANATTQAAKDQADDKKTDLQKEASKQIVKELTDELYEMPERANPRLITDDVTPEALVTLLTVQGGRMAVMSAEGGGVFEQMKGKYTKDGKSSLEVYLKGYSGDNLRTDRVGRDTEYVRKPALTIALAIQPAVLTQLSGRSDMRGRGLLGRFSYVLPANLLGLRNPDAKPVSDATQERYNRLVTTLLELSRDRGAAAIYTLRLSDEAQGTFRAFELRVEGMLGESGTLAHMTDWGGKLVGTVGRIAAILHMAESIENHTCLVPDSTMKNAITIGEYLISHARAAYGEIGTDEALEDAKFMLRWIKRTKVERSKSGIFTEAQRTD